MQARGSILILALLASGCATNWHWYFSNKPHDHDAHWSYEGETGPEHWGDLSPTYRIAKEGRRQSPIDVVWTKAEVSDLPPLVFHYLSEPASFVNNGHTLQHDERSASWISLGGKRFDLRQFHFHTPSEHTIAGRHAPAEIHLVHRGSSGKIVVIAILVEVGASDSEMLKAIRSMPHEHGGESVVRRDFDPIELIPDRHDYFTYEGSFTTPPCTEGVTWIVMNDPFRADPAALKEVRGILDKNNRPVQPLHGRKIKTNIRR